jgi:hypothetical protein
MTSFVGRIGIGELPRIPADFVRESGLARIRLVQILICLLPFVVFYWLLPFAGTRTIGNDYRIYSIQHQMELQYSLAHGTFPLYAPGFAGGRSAAALTLGQMYHPISWFASHSPGYWEGFALEWNTFWRLVSLGLTQLVLFNLILRLRLRTDMAFIVSFITVYNMRGLDMFRYGAALENYTGFLLLCASMTYLYLAPDKFLRPLAVIGATYLLVCGGHPQIAYLGLLGAAMICATIPYAIAAIQPNATPMWHNKRTYYSRVLLCFVIVVLIAAPYTIPFYIEFIQDAPSRVGQTYIWSLANSDHLGGAINSFFNPLRSDVHGGFGSSSLILLAILPPLVLAPIRAVRGRMTMALMVIVSVVIFLCSVGADTPLHYWFWRILPFADSFRTPGRIAMLLPPFLMFILIWFFRMVEDRDRAAQMLPIAPAHISLAALAVFVVEYFVFAHPRAGKYTPFFIRHCPWWVSGVIFLSGVACLLLVTLRISPMRAGGWSGVLLSVVVIAQSTLQFTYGTWTAPRVNTPTFEQMDEAKRSALAFRGDAGYGMESSEEASLDVGANAAVRHKRYQPSTALAVFRPAPTIAPSPAYRPPSAQELVGHGDPVRTVYTTFNRLVFKVDASAPGYLTLTLPYSPQWRATVESRESSVVPTLRNELAVYLPAGSQEIDLRFHSTASVVGMLISCATLLLVSLFFARRFPTGWMRNVTVLLVFVVLIGGFAWWEHSLFSGDDLGMQFKSSPSSW